MAEPGTTGGRESSRPDNPSIQPTRPEHDPTTPMPDDPQKHEPMRDPPAHPAHDPGTGNPTRVGVGENSIESPDPSPPDPSPTDAVFDENRLGR